MRLILALMLTTTPVWAEDATNLDRTARAEPGAVASYVQATGLYALGRAAQDPLMVLTAARLLRGLTLTDTARTPDPAPETPSTLTPLDPQTLIETATALDTGQTYTDLAERVATELAPQPLALRATAASLAPATSQIWTIPFFGGSYAELAIVGDGKSNLDLTVTDASGAQICLDNGSADTALCGFTLRDNGDVKVTVTNSGTASDTYILLTN